MAKYVQVTAPRKTVGAYLRAVKALNELNALGEDLFILPYEDGVAGTTGKIIQNQATGEWSFVQA